MERYILASLERMFGKKKQTTFVYCPKCNNELVKNGDLIKDTDFVYYKCSKCGHESKWDFDTPCPILLEDSKCGHESKWDFDTPCPILLEED